MSTAYAWERPCLRCGGQNDAHHKVESDAEVERVANELAELLQPVCAKQGRMLGVMRADGEWIVSLSSVASVSQDFVNIVLDYNATMSPIAHDWSTVPVRSLGGHDIRSLLVTRESKKPAKKTSGKTSTPAPTPLNSLFKVHADDPSLKPLPIAGGPGCFCAAPKLVSYLTQDSGSQLLPPGRINMIELWCGAASATRKHREVATSCLKCANILPTLMCRAT